MLISVLFLSLAALISTVFAVSSIPTSSIIASPNPINVNGENITINATVNYASYDGTGNAWILIDSPFEKNISMQEVGRLSDHFGVKYTGTYDPNVTGQYSYYIYAEADGGGYKESDESKTFDSVTYPYVPASWVEPEWVRYDMGAINVSAEVLYWDNPSEIDSVILQITSPVQENITMQQGEAISSGFVYYMEYNPSEVAIYKYRIFSNSTTGISSYSGEYSFQSKGYAPEINELDYHPSKFPPGETVFFTVNVTDPKDDLDTVLVKIVAPISENIVMEENESLSGIFHANYTTDIDSRYIYYFYVWANDTGGETTISGLYSFSSRNVVFDNTTIMVSISPSCNIEIFFPFPEYVIQNQSVILISIVTNIGNVELYEQNNITIEKDVIDEFGEINESKLVKVQPNIIDFWQASEEHLDLKESTFFWRRFYTEGLPVGNYTSNSTVYFHTNTTVEGQNFLCNGTIMASNKFQIITEFGQSQMPPVLLIREMPEYISQNPDCNATDPWGEDCTSTKIRLILYNSGNEAAYNLSLIDSSKATCSGDCTPVAFKCVENGYNYTCNDTVEFNSTEQTSLINFTFNESLDPRQYIMVEYEFSPSNTTSLYGQTKSNRYTFTARADYEYGADATPYVSVEDRDHYNPEYSNVLYLMNKSAFNYELTVGNESEMQERLFNIRTNTTFRVTAVPITGGWDIVSPWYAQISTSPSWNITSCSHVSGPNCECSFNNTLRTVTCNSSSTLSENELVVFEFVASTPLVGDFLLPVYSTDSAISRMMDEDYVPGLFTISQPIEKEETPKPEPEPEPEPTPEPTPQPTPVPEPIPEPEPKVEIVLTPINISYDAYQGQTIPTYFDIENIGLSVVTNISIEPALLLDGWDYSETLIDRLNVSSTVNRTMLITPPLDAKPGIYTIPIRAAVRNQTADLAYIWIEVLEKIFTAKLWIVESPETIELNPLSNVTIPLLLQNIGDKELHNISMRIENAENCILGWDEGDYYLNVTQVEAIDLRVETNKGPATCNANIIVSSKEGAYAYAPIKIIIKSRPALMFLGWNITPLLALLWTILLVAYASIRKKKAKEGYIPLTNKPKIILYMLIAGEVIILLYVLLWYFGIIDLL